jgi:DNA-binding Xre family transcriptional regulator
MEDVARAVGVSRSTLAGLTRWDRRLPVTNTALLEALCRYFRRSPNELLEFEPAIGVEHFVNVDELYRQRAIRRRIDRDEGGV